MTRKNGKSKVFSLFCILCLLLSLSGNAALAEGPGLPGPEEVEMTPDVPEAEARPAATEESEEGDFDELSLPLLRSAGGDVSEKTDITVTSFEFQSDSGTPQTSLKHNAWYRLRLSWNASAYGNTLHSGDYFIVTLPDEMRFPTTHSATHFDI